MQRREFIKSGSCLFVLSCALGHIISSCSTLTGISATPMASPESFTVKGHQMYVHFDHTNKLCQPGGSLKLSYIDSKTLKRVKVLVINSRESGYVTVENCCPQCGSELEYDSTSGIINCVSIAHSKFNLQGEVIKGPAREKLHIFHSQIIDGELVIDLV